MNALKNFKDILEYILIHFICTDKFCIYFVGAFLLSLNFYEFLDENLLIILAILGVMFLKIFGLLIYYKRDYKRVKNPLIIKLIDLLRQNKKHSRVLFLFIITLPSNIVIMQDALSDYEWWYSFCSSIFFQYIILNSLLSYKILFSYWDISNYKHSTNCTGFNLFKHVLKKTIVFILIYILIIVIFINLPNRSSC